MDVEQNLALLRELVRCGGDIYTWCYDAAGELLESNCPEQDFLGQVFAFLGCRDKMLAHWAKHTNPITLGSGIGFVWSAAFEQRDGRPHRAWVLGPFFYTDVSMKSIEAGFGAYLGLEVSVAWKARLTELLYHTPTVPHLVSVQNLLMLHYCLTGERLTASDLGAAVMAEPAYLGGAEPGRDRHKVWSAEQALLQMVRNGDLDYKKALSASQGLSNGVHIHTRDPLGQGRISVIVFCSIVCRAAIEGGLSPEEAYALGDSYIQSAEDARTLDELYAIPLTMYDDFIRRVHRCRTNPRLSTPVQKCVDYIELHLSERIRAEDLAAAAGYSEYYITQKFREEIGYSFTDYAIFAKVERAKVLLRDGDRSVQELADELGFSTRSHFSRCFRRVTGKSPAEYRGKMRKVE